MIEPASQASLWDQAISTLAALDHDAEPDFIRLLDRCQLTVGASGLDIGCGAARHTAFAANRGFRMIGVDFSTAALALASQRLANVRIEARLELGSSHDLHFESESFDFSFAWCVLNHGSEAFFRRSLEESLRVVKSSGYTFGMVMSRSDPRYGRGDLVDDHCFRFTEGPEAGVLHYFPSQSELLSTLAANGRILEFSESCYSDSEIGDYFPGLEYSYHYIYLLQRIS